MIASHYADVMTAAEAAEATAIAADAMEATATAADAVSTTVDAVSTTADIAEGTSLTAEAGSLLAETGATIMEVVTNPITLGVCLVGAFGLGAYIAWDNYTKRKQYIPAELPPAFADESDFELGPVNWDQLERELAAAR
ncbi:hypothetical protein [Nodosilinea nodulosa]|uniref:hypothetical protein n=1 Tax=Nodosilinea nodulosa TaxID=416001 RepID=UPI00035F3574|nr:hypothetical protein [Nodosilinea nodulosa]